MSLQRYSKNHSGSVFKDKEITGLEDFNVSLQFAMCLKAVGCLDLVLPL